MSEITIHYVRISNHNRAAHDDAKRAQLLAFADQSDVFYVDSGISGLTPPLERPGFSAMAKLIENQVDDGVAVTVRVASRDRLGRHRQMDEAIEILHALGADIETPDGLIKPADTETNQEWLMTNVLQLFSEYERREIVAKLARGKAAARGQGRHTGGRVPFGFVKGDDGTLHEVPEEQEQIRCFRQEVASGSSVRQAYLSCGIPEATAYRIIREDQEV